MTIQCQVCLRTFNSVISSSHLKTHSMTTGEYKKKFGDNSLASDEYRKLRSQQCIGENNPNYGNTWTPEQKQNLSEKTQGRIPWNKGMTFDDCTTQKKAVEKRELRYKNGELERYIPVWTDESKERIRESVKKYAKENPQKMKERSKKAAQTRKENGYEPFFKGKKHTDETKAKISEKSIITARKKAESAKKIKEVKITESKLRLIEDYGNVFKLECEVCNTEFSITSQYFNPCKYKKEMCPTCYPRNTYRSNGEIELFDFVKSIHPTAIPNNRSILGNREIDIYVPEKNIAIEYNGLYWHSESVLDSAGYSKLKDMEKMEKLATLGKRLIMVYEDEWCNKRSIVESRIRNILGDTDLKSIGARKTKVREISSKEASVFCQENHIQGKARSNIRVGLFDVNNTLVSVMTFSKNNISRNVHKWEINRFCTTQNKRVVGGASKLFKFFTNLVKPDEVISYADRRWSTGGLYQSLGFEFNGNTRPGYWYIEPNSISRIHRYTLRKNKNDDQSLTEYENRLAQGYLRIWDCGHSRWLWQA